MLPLPPPPAEPSLPPVLDGGAPAGPVVCPRRVLPPVAIVRHSPAESHVALAWGRDAWGVAWAESGEEHSVFFARVGALGWSLSGPTRINDHSIAARQPALVWNGDAWLLSFAATVGNVEELWLGRIDARGTPMGHPERLTARDRFDHEPALAFNGRRVLAAWATQLGDGRSAMLTVQLDRWGAQQTPPVVVHLRDTLVAAPALLPVGEGWTAAWLLGRSHDLEGIDLARLDARGASVGDVARVTEALPGSTLDRNRFTFAWDGATHAVLWDELRQGATQLFLRTYGRTTRPLGPARELTSGTEPAAHPSVVALGPGRFALAWQQQRGTDQLVLLRTLDASGQWLDEGLSVRGNDGEARSPTLAWGEGQLGLVTASAHGLSLHRVLLEPCAR